MAVENFEQILQCINNSEIRIALERLFALCGVGTGSDGTAINKDVVGDLTGNVEGNVVGDVTGTVTKLLAGTAPKNAVQASAVLTFTGVSVDEDIVTIGDDVYEINDVEGEITAGRIWVDLGDTQAATIVAALVAAVNASGTEAVTAVDGDGTTTVELLADTPGVLANAIVTTTDISNASFPAATMLGGVDGTVGAIGTAIIASTGLYIAKAANTIVLANWKLFPFIQYMGTGASPQTIAASVDMSDTDFLSDTIFLDGSAACVITDWLPTVGVTYTINCIESTNDPVVNLKSGIKVDASDNDILTFDTAEDTIVIKMVTASRMVILSNDGVTMSGA
jgi:hypothetical protein